MVCIPTQTSLVFFLSSPCLNIILLEPYFSPLNIEGQSALAPPHVHIQHDHVPATIEKVLKVHKFG